MGSSLRIAHLLVLRGHKKQEGSSSETVKTKVLCHSRHGTIKIPPCSSENCEIPIWVKYSWMGLLAFYMNLVFFFYCKLEVSSSVCFQTCQKLYHMYVYDYIRMYFLLNYAKMIITIRYLLWNEKKKIVIENSHLGIINVRNIHHHYIYAKQLLKVLLDTYTLIY